MKKRYFILGIIIILLDQIVKYLMINKDIVVIENVLKFSFTKNYGMAFSIGNGIISIIISSILIILLIAFIIVKRNEINNLIPFILILAGGISNLIDRIFRGYVIDYISVFKFAIFNIADSFIVIGVLMLVFVYIKGIMNKNVKKIKKYNKKNNKKYKRIKSRKCI